MVAVNSTSSICGGSKILTWTGKYKSGAIARVRVGKSKFGARTGKNKLWATAGKYKFGPRAGKYKLGAKTRGQGQGSVPGPGPGKHKDLF